MPTVPTRSPQPPDVVAQNAGVPTRSELCGRRRIDAVFGLRLACYDPSVSRRESGEDIKLGRPGASVDQSEYAARITEGQSEYGC
jgi:hypothetical protein